MLRLFILSYCLKGCKCTSCFTDPCLDILICLSSFADNTVNVGKLVDILMALSSTVMAYVCVACVGRVLVLLILIYIPVVLATLARFCFTLHVMVEQYHPQSPSLQVLS